MRSADLTREIDRWADSGVITTEQANRMRADLPPEASHRSLIAEGLGYVGGSLVAIALIVISSQYWTEIGTAGRLIVVGLSALVLASAGRLTPPRADGPAGRLRAVLWAGATATTFAWLLLAGRDLLGLNAEEAMAVAAAGAVICASAFWAAHRHPLQHVVAWLSLLVMAAALVDLLPGPDLLPWAGIWATGLAWGLLSWGEVIRPAHLGRVLGALAAVAAAATLAQAGWEALLAAGTVFALVVAAVALRDLVVLVVAAAGALVIVPAVTSAYFPGSVTAALATLTVGVVLVGAAVAVARGRLGQANGRLGRANGGTTPTPAAATAVAAAAVVLLLSAAGILLATV
ncbi:DUF2157 domain-containing protein [Paractinoplanes brasiliensis]|uniref:DUF2157 domain-containing protein n=1 Tax=Paractinoplanes brasiliensis TaxID=52695 RepID=A0A4R6JE71_9ACTN|nr:hypothetical protein [Actinoplanes brasiliensis]TDO32866.1 hypothetical protein C8E87_8338 [Actinoplanes brasiliensis]GID31589.1 hypothetical protein Abr02nite_65720 [Actinoplanes brasiliensis]